MGDRIDELSGHVTEGVGDLTGNDRLEVEREADRLRGKANRLG
jgi:uncharacterized protein YjbJ (UPF0337 family)